MPTAQIAKNLPKISLDEKKQIDNFCKEQIPLKFEKNLDASAEDSFWKGESKKWKLIVYSELAKQKSYFYKIEDGKIFSIDYIHDFELDWLTEITEYKLYSALNNGESLTSLYIRINDIKLNDKAEINLQDIDLLEDPLLQCLYNEDIAQYQRRQLIQIRESKNDFRNYPNTSSKNK